MLSSLRVKNLAVVESAVVNFGDGLNVVTGETGAGKSVLIGALNLVLGDRANHDAIRSGAGEMTVEAQFSTMNNRAVDDILADAGLPPCEDGTLVIRRSVMRSGAAKCWINDAPSTVQTLRRLGTHLVDMHGPYDHQSLLSEDFQLALLDSFGHVSTESAGYDAAYREYRDKLRERDELTGGSSAELEEEIDRLRFSVSEISDANLTDDDDEDLVNRHAEAANAAQIIESGNAVVAALTDGEGSAFDALASVQQSLAEMRRIFKDASEWHDEAASAAVQIQELSRTISDRLAKVDVDPAQMELLEERMALVQKLKRKYGKTVADVLAVRDARQKRLDELLSRNERLATIDEDVAKALEKVKAVGAKLTAIRAKTAAKLAKSFTRELAGLGFNQSLFDVAVSPAEPSATGLDRVSFVFAPNPGEPPRPLAEIASAGEIARVMLAAKSVLAEQDLIPVLVFDEIDSNIGGETGRTVGAKLRKLSKSHQIITITHLPQVAAFGQTHFSVKKSVKGGRTATEIRELGQEERAVELTRMLGGTDFTSVTLEHAREMLAACAEK